MAYINISGYKFFKLSNLKNLQEQLKTFCVTQSLKGTILISFEGINAFLCGERQQIDAFYDFCHTHALHDINFKESLSNDIPFKQMKVKIKREIITMGVPDISPAIKPAPAVSAQMLKAWLDEKKDIVLLDTRNDYEIAFGKFKNAVDLKIEQFTHFPEAASNLPENLKNKTIVTYCTGGIRCEKAAPFLKQQGFQEVYQLQGGILKYLEKCGNAHFEGTCFVFDNRVAVNHHLQEIPRNHE